MIVSQAVKKETNTAKSSLKPPSLRIHTPCRPTDLKHSINKSDH